ncbi:MAG TPA: globin domain-containing protein [Streptosporangiales bacterium]
MDTRSLQDSWAVVAKSGEDVPHFFYGHLFLTHPELREMFPVSMAAQRDKLVSALGRIVSNVDRLAEVTPFVEQLGRDHRRFDVVAQHYPAVGASLLATLQHFLGAAWNERLATDWAEAYGLIAKVMVTAAEQAEESEPPWWPAEVVSVERRTLDVSVLQLRPEQSFSYEPGQSFAMEVPSRPRLWRYYSPANAPRDDGTVEVHVQLVAGGQVSTSITRSLKPGDRVRMGAPVGDRLTLPDVDDDGSVLMVAGGTGLAPLRAVIEQLDRRWANSGAAPRVQLFHGARWAWNLYEHQLLTGLAGRTWFDYTPVISDDSSYPGVRGLVGSVAARRASTRDCTTLVCGPSAMVEHTVAELVGAGHAENRIRYELFDKLDATDTRVGQGGDPSDN